MAQIHSQNLSDMLVASKSPQVAYELYDMKTSNSAIQTSEHSTHLDTGLNITLCIICLLSDILQAIQE